MNSSLLNYYEAIEKASADMLDAARAGNWDHVIKLEGACVLLISRSSCSACWSTMPRFATWPNPGWMTWT